MTNHTVSDQQAVDILTNAVEGGFMEEFRIIRRVQHTETYETLALSVVCEDHDVDGVNTWVVGPEDIRRGIDTYGAWIANEDPAMRSYLGEQWREALEDGWEYFDAIGADAVIQFACFGEVVFG